MSNLSPAERIQSKLAARTPDAVMKRYARMAQSASKRMTRRGAAIGAIGGGALGAAAGALNADLSPRDEVTGKKPSMLRGALGGAAIGSVLGGGMGALEGKSRGRRAIYRSSGDEAFWTKRKIQERNHFRGEAKNLGVFDAAKKKNKGVKDSYGRWNNIKGEVYEKQRQQRQQAWDEAGKKWDEYKSRSSAGGGWGAGGAGGGAGWGGSSAGGGGRAGGSAGGGSRGGGWGGSSAGGRTADKNPGGYWDKVNIPDNVKRKAKGAAAHAKKTSGPEGDVAKKILRDLANKHGFDYDEAIKTASELRDMVRSNLNRRRKNTKKGGKSC